MSSVGELSVGVSCDPSEFTAGMTQVRDDLNATTTVIQRQEASWSSLAVAAIPAIGQITASVASLAGTAMVINHQRSMIASVGSAMTSYGLLAVKIAGMILPQWRLISLAVGGTALAYKVATSEMGSSAVAAAAKSDTLSGAIDKIKATTAELSTAITAPFAGAVSSVGQLAYEFLGVDAILKSAKSTAMSWATSISEGIETATKAVYRYGDTAVTALAISQSWFTMTSEASAAFYDEAGSLRQVAAATDAVIAKQEAQRDSFKSLRSIQEQSAQTAANAAEVAHVASIITVEGIEAELNAVRERARVAIGSGDEWKAQTTAMTAALERQRQGILDGTVIDQAAVDAKKALAKATEESAKAAELAAKAAADAAEKEQQKTLSGLAKITAMKDQIDLMNGSATNAEVAMREMWRSGFSQEQIDEVGSLTEELDRLKEEEANSKKKDPKEKSGKSGPDSLKAAFQGSSEAASIMLAGVGGGKSIEDIAGKQLTVAQQQLAATKANKPQPMTAIADFGAGA